MSTVSLPARPVHLDPVVKANDLVSRVHAEQQYRPMEPADITPYLSHPMAVAGIVYQYGGTHIEATAAECHDMVEDHANQFGGREKALAYIATEFGKEVASIVAEVTDPEIVDAKARKDFVNARAKKNYSHSAWLVKSADFLNTLNAVLASILCWGPNATFQGFLANDAKLPITEQLKLWTKNNERLYGALYEADYDLRNHRKRYGRGSFYDRERHMDSPRQAGYRKALLCAIDSEIKRVNQALIDTDAFERNKINGVDWRDLLTTNMTSPNFKGK